MQNNSNKSWSFYYGSVLVYALVFWFWEVQPVPFALYLIGVALWAVALFPLALWYRNGFQGLPMFELICVAYGLAYGPPIYLVPNQITIWSQSFVLSNDIVFQSACSGLLGLVALITGYYLFGSRTRKSWLPPLDLPLRQDLRYYYIYVALGLGLVAKLLGSFASERFGSIFHLFEGQFEIGIILLAYQAFADVRVNFRAKMLLIASVALWIAFGLVGGMLESVVVPLVLVFLVRWHVRRQFPWILACAIAGGFLILTPLKMQYRERAWYGNEGNAGMLASLNIWWEAAGDVLAGERLGEEKTDSVGEATARVDLLHKFAYVQSLTPNEIPYFQGKSYLYLVYTFIPRFLWPGKPLATEVSDSVDFAYKLRSEENTSAKIAIGLIAEAYANFGWAGVVFVMFLQGLFFQAINRVLNGPQSDGGRAIYLSIMVVFLNGVGGTAVVLFGSVIQSTLASAFIMRPFASGFRVQLPVAFSARQQRQHARRLVAMQRSSATVASGPTIGGSTVQKPPI